MSHHKCCSTCPTGCCQVGGDSPYWQNRYCFQLTVFGYLHKECQCNDYLDPCERCAEAGDCDAVNNDPVTGHPPCVECCREREIRICASGALFRTPHSISGCSTTSDAPDTLWSSICGAGTYSPPNIGSSVGGVTSFYSSPPCDCSIAQNDRVTWIGSNRDEDINGCCDADDFDESINCVSGQAVIECADDDCDRTRFPCCNLTASRTHYLKISLHTAGSTEVAYNGCTCGNVSSLPDLRFVFAAELSRNVGPHLATWRLIGIEEITNRSTGTYTQFDGDCNFAPLGQLPCNEPNCCDTPPGPCCGDCSEWTCSICSPTSCGSCYEASFDYPKVQLLTYQNCTAPTCT